MAINHPHGKNDTLIDLNRRDITFPKNQIQEVLPEFFRGTYPKLISRCGVSTIEFETGSDHAPSKRLIQ